jgi:hypothetical protein
MIMNRITTLFVSLCAIIIGVTTPSLAFAAGLDLITFSTSPTVPGPNQEVTVKMQSFAVDLDTAEIIWYLGDDPAMQGIAQKTFTTRTGDFGKPTTLNITIVPLFGETLHKRFVIEPSEVDMLWEARTVVPPFYKGKAIPTYRSHVKVTAIPRRNSASSNPALFHYKWTYNRIMGLGDATGMNSVVIPMGYADSPVPVNVEVSMIGSDWKAPEFFNVKGGEAKVVFYEDAPLLGTLFNKGLSRSHLGAGNIFAVRAVPYFFSQDNYTNNELLYTWLVNSARINQGYDPTRLQLTKSGKGSETFSVSLRVQNPKRILQDGRAAAGITLPSEE